MHTFTTKLGRCTVLLATLFAMGFLYCGQARAASAMQPFALPNAADGSMVNSNSLRGKILLMNFFTTW